MRRRRAILTVPMRTLNNSPKIFVVASAWRRVSEIIDFKHACMEQKNLLDNVIDICGGPAATARRMKCPDVAVIYCFFFTFNVVRNYNLQIRTTEQ